ncbi:MAG: adenylate/guanylate cyclase domain-containing protein [Gaiellaceae bacterium]
MDVPDVRYARSGGVAVAYRVFGDGPEWLVFAPHLTNLFVLLQRRDVREFVARLGAGAGVVVFDPRGTGLSDRPRHVTLEARMDDITALLDANGIERATLFGVATSASVCALFAATYPERCRSLAVVDLFPQGVSTDDYPYGVSEEQWLSGIRSHRERWGDRDYLEGFARGTDPQAAAIDEQLDARVWELRLAVAPADAAEFARMGMESDITDVLGAIRVPTLVLHRSDPLVVFPPDERGLARFVAERIRDVRVVELARGSLYSDETAERVLELVRGDSPVTVPDSVLATVLFTDLVGSSERAAALGDRGWRDLLARHHADVRRELTRYRGEEVDSAGDGFFCRFDGPARAMACARAIVDGAKELDLDVRTGIHTGECELVGPKIAGIAVVTGARISSLAAPGEVLVSRTVRDLVAGSGFSFVDRGEHELTGVPGRWRLYAVVDA